MFGRIIMSKFVILLGLIFCVQVQTQNTLSTVFEWKQLDFQFPNVAERNRAINERRFIPENCVPIDTDVQFKANGQKRIFVTIPRFQEGIPATLGTVSETISPNGPLIKPYPNYNWHKSSGSDCDGITSVFRVTIDPCNRLWVLDTGRVGDDWKCIPQLLVFDLKTDTLVQRIKFPRNTYKNDSLLITPVIDVADPGQCLNTKVYMADVTGFAMLVYDSYQKSFWRIENRLFRNTPGYDNFTIAGQSFELDDGILGMALKKNSRISGRYYTPNNNRDDRHLYFHALASNYENSVPLSVLNNREAFQANAQAFSQEFQVIGNRGIQSAAQAMDSSGNLFFGLMEPSAIACWDSSTPFKKDNMKIIARNKNTLQFASGVKVVTNSANKDELWVVTNRFQKLMTDTYNWNEINFRILSRPVDEILQGRSCSGEGLGSNIVFVGQ